MFLNPGQAYGHQGEKHSKEEANSSKLGVNELQKIDESYQKNIASIFRAKCFDCHGEAQKLRWYYSLPIAKQIMNDDMTEAKEHMDMRGGFPFKGHGSPQEDLQAILEVTKNNEMPPFRYRMLHWSSKLTKDEQKKITTWVKESLRSLKGGH